MKPMTWLESWFLRSGRGVLRMVAGRYFGVPQSGEPTATSEFRAALFVEPGAAGVADELKVCLKDGADAYSWITVGVSGGVYTDEMARDAIGTALVAGNNIDITVNDPANTITVAVETLTLADITDVTSSAAELNVLDGIPATLTATELGYVDGVTSAIQTQLDAKQPLDADLTTIAGLADPNADRMLFWDDSAGAYAYLAASTGLTITTTNMTVRTASATQTGIVELATDAETTTGTDTTRAITPANFTSQIGTRVPALAHTHAAADIASGTIATARLGSGTANSSSYLRGDQTWDTIGIDELNDVAIAAPAQGQLLTYDAGSWVNADPQQGIMTLDDRTHAYVAQFGTTGTGNTNFDTPGQVAIDSSGNIYIADTANNRLKKHDSSGTYVTSITSLTAITGVCVDSSDNIYVAYRNAVNDHRVRKYNSSLSLQWTSFSASATNPLGHLTTDGTIVWVSVPGAHCCVSMTASSATPLGFFPSTFTPKTTDGGFNTPVGMTTDGTYLYVVDQGNDRIQKFTMAGAYISKWGHTGTDPGEFGTPVGIHYNSVTGFIYVTDSGRDDVQEFTTDGGFIGSFGSAGTGNGQLQDASGIANDVAGSSVWVADATQDRLQKFTRSVTSEEATRVSFNSNDFVISSTDGGETGFISLANPPDTSLAQFQDSLFRITDDADSSKQLAVEVSGITTATTRTVTAPDRDGTWVLSDGGVKKVLTASVSDNPASTANGSAFAVSVTVTGAAAGDVAICGHTSIDNSGWRNPAATVETDTVRCVWVNNTGGTVDPAAGTAYAVVFDVT